MGQASERLRTGRDAVAGAARRTRAKWGEIHLKRVVELSGMQAMRLRRAVDDQRRKRLAAADLVVKLPGGKRLVVDAKVPLTSYLRRRRR
jgi:DNA recombination protein RmuC